MDLLYTETRGGLTAEIHQSRISGQYVFRLIDADAAADGQTDGIVGSVHFNRYNDAFEYAGRCLRPA